ncbi:MAG: hypothetical protein J6R18_05965 [Kiritimatiellae bacterium]|nr:hypothetical protein [Kiritimatiellia bacterium]
MKIEKIITFSAIIFQMAISFGTERKSADTVVYLRPETSQFWSTATNSTIALPIDFPNGAEYATLEVSGLGYYRSFRIDAPSDYILQFPEPDSPQTENVYDLKLTYDNGIVRTARLGCVLSYSSTARARTRCILSSEASEWSKIKYRSVIQIPYGMTEFGYQVNGGETITVDTGSGNIASWHAFGPVKRGDQVALSAVIGDAVYDAFLFGWGEGFFLHIR